MTPLELKRYYSSEEFKNKYIYNEKDLGITYLKDKTVFKLWWEIYEDVFSFKGIL